MNNLTGLINLLIVIIQATLGIVFGIWYFRIFLAYFREVRKKDEKKKVGVKLGWAIFGMFDSIISMFMWGVLSSLIFNVPKIIYLVPFALSIIQMSYVFHNANRRKARDWLLLLYNIVAFLYVLNWTLVDFGVDLPNILGVFSHTINSGTMWWQLIFVNTSAFFLPTFIFPPYHLNPRYYFAIPVEEYYKIKDEEEQRIGGDPLKPTINDKKISDLVAEDEKQLPGERTAFFVERRKIEAQRKDVIAMQKEAAKLAEEDTRFAEFVGLKDFAIHIRKFVRRLDSIISTISLSVILSLIIITPVVFAGNVTLNILPNYEKLNYTLKPGMVLAVKGNAFTYYDINGNISRTWVDDLNKEINLAKELHATHLRYDVNSRGLINSLTRSRLATGLQDVKDEGLKLILTLIPNQPQKMHDLLNTIYLNSSYIAQNYQPDYIIICNEINGELQSYSTTIIEDQQWLSPIANFSNRIKTLNPSTKVGTSVLAVNDGKDIFETLMINSTLNIDFVGINFFPVLFGWRSDILNEYSTIAKDASSTVDFWISEIGMESFNFGEDAQAKYLAHIASLSSSLDDYNADGLCIMSLIDNLGYSTEQGIVSHLGLVYYNGRKKKAFEALTYAFSKIQGII
ncbi:MAG: hypothetical protein FK730_08770 [Asgard group archaeon]|nr:hypothetical protein [Asgard group archaeon]